MSHPLDPDTAHELLHRLADEEGRLIALLVEADPDPHALEQGRSAVDAVLTRLATLPPERLLGSGTDLETARATALRLAEALRGQAVWHRERIATALGDLQVRHAALGAYRAEGSGDERTPMYVDRQG